jgi:hypothetical protein
VQTSPIEKRSILSGCARAERQLDPKSAVEMPRGAHPPHRWVELPEIRANETTNR